MKSVRLSHDTTPEVAEGLIWRALATRPARVVVRLNGFPAAKLRAVAARLPEAYTLHRTDANTLTLTRSADTLTVFTGNLDFLNLLRSDRVDASTIKGLGAQAFLGQELSTGGHHLTDLAELFPGWHVTQGKGAKSQTGVAVSGDFTSTGGGFALGLAHIPGVGMNERFIAYRDVQLSGRTVRLASVHLPPARFNFLWPVYAARIAAFVHLSPHPVILGGDFNARFSGPQVRHLAAVTGLRPSGLGIDGFLYSRQLVAGYAQDVTNTQTRSDHPFKGLTFRWAR